MVHGLLTIGAILGASGLAAAAGPGGASGETGATAQPASPDEVRAIVAEMMSDAETRSSLRESGATAGHEDGRFFIASPDGRFTLKPYGLIQFRYLADWRSEENTVGAKAGDSFVSGFDTRRTKIGVTGNIFGKDLTYNVYVDTSRSAGALVLNDSWAEYKIQDGLRVRGGQFKFSLLREELVSDEYQLAIERSLVNSVFTQGRSQGVSLYSDNDAWYGAVGFSNGLNGLNKAYTDPGPSGFIPSGTAEFAVNGRLEWMIEGTKKDLKEFTAVDGQALTMMLGGAVWYQQNPSTQTPNPDQNILEYTTDFTVKGSGWNAFATFIGRNDQGQQAGADTDFNDFGALVQGGFRVADDTELYARWDALWTDPARGLTDNFFQFVTVGVNQYLYGQAAKFTVDCVYSVDDTADLVQLKVLPNFGSGLLGDSKPGETLLRFQFQLLF